ncbi:signal transducer and activator of transcription 1-alpha/beta-like isoform X2 [Simochromis diagramma]|uniref:signal transducer and activator of transcription 1-alpha/beta-like isoform X2 n=1 Tax=Simochromis diagramma TaxID=43689 RepID=UPI001A7ED13C|nr:signal transducer and activator of transcription 1-alpha/beta-like isoform X2 [Simochromis diagramma]
MLTKNSVNIYGTPHNHRTKYPVNISAFTCTLDIIYLFLTKTNVIVLSSISLSVQHLSRNGTAASSRNPEKKRPSGTQMEKITVEEGNSSGTAGPVRGSKRKRKSSETVSKEAENRCSNPGMEQNQPEELMKWFMEVDQLHENHKEVKENALLANICAALEEKIVQHQLNILTHADQIVEILTNVELPKWKRWQQLACIGIQLQTLHLKNLEKQFTTVAKVLLGIYKQLLKQQDWNIFSLHASMPKMENFALTLFRKLVTKALVVEKQPVMQNYSQRPLILKVGVQFSMTVRFLVNIPEIWLKVKPVFDKDVEEAKTVKGFRLFDFNKDVMKPFEDTDGGLVVEFGQMSLKETKSRIKGSSENLLTVTEELHIIKFMTEFQYARQMFNIEASSLPVVVISSTSQVTNAWASIMWWNTVSTSEPWDLSLFLHPPPLTWEQLSQVLSWQFYTIGQRWLDEMQLSMLRDKIVGARENGEVPEAGGTTGADVEGHCDVLVDWRSFSKNESGWIWIDAFLDLIKKHLLDLWKNGYIMGFVTSKRVKQLLQEKQSGTFLLHFTESNGDAAITFSWVDRDSNDKSIVTTVEPYTKKELSKHDLLHIIYHFRLESNLWGFPLQRDPLLYFYPDVPKDPNLEKHKSPESPSEDGYLRRAHPFKADDPIASGNDDLEENGQLIHNTVKT